jgi:hypothetical protein
MIMALSSFFFAAAYLLLFTLVIVASASDIEKKISAGNKENLLSTIIGIQGLVYCKSGSKFIPLEGNSYINVTIHGKHQSHLFYYLKTTVNFELKSSQYEIRVFHISYCSSVQ